ncbi:protein CcpR [Neisseria gonorrhoeae]|uniref:Protein CcpR n=1 Tax=Neisseria gonorrhoeae TaxID=485 RepID=A0A379B0S4_NEIGO|nr:protein CcpR [Neisseria gonorrhoeae]
MPQPCFRRCGQYADQSGHKGQFGGRNSPTALNAALLGSQFWDGRAADVEEQAGGPLVNPVEMANDSQEAAAAKIAKVPEYQEMFKKAFPEDGAVSFKTSLPHWVRLSVPC